MTHRLALLASLALATLPQLAVAQAAADFDRLDFLAGCWEMQRGNRVTHEQWMPPLGGLMIGMSRTVVDGRAREWEALTISVRDSVIQYGAQPGGRPATYFAATQVTDSSVRFSNSGNDFPDRILYFHRGQDSLVARVESGQGEQRRGIDFPMRRVACGAE